MAWCLCTANVPLSSKDKGYHKTAAPSLGKRLQALVQSVCTVDRGTVTTSCSFQIAIERSLEAALPTSASRVERQAGGAYLGTARMQDLTQQQLQEAGGIEYQIEKELTPLESRLQSLSNAEEV